MPEGTFSGEFIPFRFRVTLCDAGGAQLCEGAFSEVTGLEATMTPKAIKVGGHNWGEVQLSGPTTFPPLILKRGITQVADLWTWFDLTTRQANYGLRYDGVIEVMNAGEESPRLRWRIHNALPTKFKGADLSATANQVALEELHLVHEGLVLERNP